MTSTYSPRLSSPGSAVIVTGGASGIGLASAHALAAVGRPVAIWDINGEAAERAAALVAQDTGTKCHFEEVDMRRLENFEAALERCRAALPPLGGLVHCAGVVDTGSLEGITPESWQTGIDIHLRALAFMTQAMAADLARNPGSAIVAITSINATLGNAMNPIYSAAKGGMLSLVRSLADRLARDGIRINSVSPGQILTAMMRPAVENLEKGHFEKRILLERLGAPEEVGRVVRFLLSDEASYITAAEVVVDGGNISSQRG
ncbi:SDR family NAD(P)-dependent oxidoreductase [Novosphingobium mathurense]|uniref:NAD(P)-dependent dehydrogenase, short-chain alcohol dehydrogenase family n=1 Tax=Novosphingobium mathurense TaxID=428990 RepID=A0A1U6HXQ8_9SPHN|nr:SDR family oxidoreductase [Novosphingobium mathurense]SLK00451.1 NAD(P)-dependent dehydrogenase, short-chain alcohol dehydrogenase family [Novosphingobium mathurense]